MSVVPFGQGQTHQSFGATVSQMALAQMINPGAKALAEAEAQATIQGVSAGVQNLRIQNAKELETLNELQSKTRLNHEKHCAHCSVAKFDTANCVDAFDIAAAQRRVLGLI